METTQTLQIDYAIEKLTPAFSKLQELGIQGYGVLIKQQYVEGIGTLLTMFLAAIVIALLIVQAKKAYYRPDPDNKDNIIGWGDNGPSLAFFLTVPAVFMSLVLSASIFAGQGLTIAVGHLVNPNYYAIESIIGLVK
jgi:hypothetical protein